MGDLLNDQALTFISGEHPVVRNAISHWAESTSLDGSRKVDIVRDKKRVVGSFFSHIKLLPNEVTPDHVLAWIRDLKRRGLSQNTIYQHASLLSSFYTWALKHSELSQHLNSNPVKFARPKALKPYQAESTRSLTDEELDRLVSVVKEKAEGGSIVAKRDYALLLIYITTGMRRNEVITLRGSDLKRVDDTIVIAGKIKGGWYLSREVTTPLVSKALLDYLRTAHRLRVLQTKEPLWIRHDRKTAHPSPLTSHCFVRNLKLYAKEAGLESFHLHQTRHTYARQVSELTGSIVDTQHALDHKNPATTEHYVRRVAIKKDKFSKDIASRLQTLKEKNKTFTQ
jgi:integrase